MLDNDTKRRIDDCRDILVGKLPDPKSQVEQITIALIYKFMDDMDKEALEFGGEATFFTGEYEKYAWSKIFDPKLGGFDMLSLYSEAILKMNQNPNIPQLFRDIFKNAYLPYRDPETLKLFLKTINEFHYDHSEKLGDAFEYLLSVLGSQGDAGQFRTPRHIIDFIIEVVQPKKNETICDPACGTAGFLISSYKHILRANTKRTKGDMLTPQERKNLVENFVGYDISPDMVRLSLVNMYLHNFPAPHVYEYDTLTSEERWSEYFDVIMANPPFMTPKGGIKPHKKFTMKANRSEVLFVDYIAEHINPTTGRAGVIVPEGIIFQSGTAYKSLRKMLIESGFLYAVVSLPAGVFNPYSGVKTSILLMDKTLAQKTDKILFVKIANDGFGLGAQRKELQTSDIPDAINIIHEFQTAVRNGNTSKFENEELPLQSIAVEKSRIAENGDYNLSADRYKANERHHSKFDWVNLGDICENLDSQRKPVTASDRNKGEYPYYGASGIVDYVDDYIFDGDFLLVSEDGANLRARVTPIAFSVTGKVWVNNHAHILKFANKATQTFIELYLNSINLDNYITGSAQPKLNQASLNSIKIPLPPLPVQKEIVEKIEGYQRIIDGAKQVVANYKPQIDIEEHWETVKVGDVCTIKSGGTPSRNNSSYWNGNIAWIKTGQINFNRIYEADEFITEEGLKNSSARIIPKGTILMAMYGQGITRGKVAVLEINATINQACAALILTSKKVDNEFLFQILISKYEYMRQISDDRGGNQGNLNSQMIREIPIPLPPLSVQKEIVANIEREQELVNANKELICVFEAKIKATIDKIWEHNEKAMSAA